MTFDKVVATPQEAESLIRSNPGEVTALMRAKLIPKYGRDITRDVEQKAWSDLLRSIHGYDCIHKMSTYIVTTAERAALQHYRDFTKKSVKMASFDVKQHDVAAPADEAYSIDEVRHWIRSEKDDQTRTVLIGRFINGKTLEVIGTEIGRTKERVRQIINDWISAKRLDLGLVDG